MSLLCASSLKRRTNSVKKEKRHSCIEHEQSRVLTNPGLLKTRCYCDSFIGSSACTSA